MMSSSGEPPSPFSDDPLRPGKARAELTRLSRLSEIAVGGGERPGLGGRSGLNVAELLSRYVEEAVAATGATRGFVALAEAHTGGLALAATAGAGWSEATRAGRLGRRRADEDGGRITARVAASGDSVRIDDIAGVADYEPFFAGVRSVLVVPIIEPGKRVRGVINLESDQAGEFTSDEEAFVATLADLAALRLAMNDLQAREAALVQIGKELVVASDADALMKRVADVAAEILRFEDCSLFLIDKATRRAVLVATRGPLAPHIGTAFYELGEGLTGWVAASGQAVRLRDVAADPRHKGVHREMATDEIGSFLAVPIRAHTGVVGVLRVLRKKSTSPWFPNDFTVEDEQVLSTIASQVGAAVDNAQLFARLVQAERMAAWGEMSAMSSHMIGNRVFAIKGDLNEIEHVLSAGETIPRPLLAPLVAGMKKGIFRLEELLGEFRDFVRATALSTVPLDANELAGSVVGETFPRRGPVQLSEDYAPGPLPILADPTKLRRALAEIIENAVTFQDTGGRLVVTTRRAGASKAPAPIAATLPRGGSGAAEYAVVSFVDAGPGVPDADKTKIFQPFFTSRNRGMGLGLAIVKGIIEAHHGAIAEVGKPGEGAHFVIYLPLRRDED